MATRVPLRAAVNADATVEVTDGNNTLSGTGHVYAAFYGSITTAEGTLTLSHPHLPPFFGKLPNKLPIELPQTIELQFARFTRMHELNRRRAEVNVNFNLDHRNVHITLTVNVYQDALQSDLLDELYLKALMWYRNIYPGAVDKNQHPYHHQIGDKPTIDNKSQADQENARTRRTLRSIAKYPKPEKPNIVGVGRIYDRLRALEDKAKATIIAILNLKPFTEVLASLVDGATVQLAPITMLLFECFNIMDSKFQPAKELLAVLMKTLDGTAIGMIAELCKVLDAEARAGGKNVNTQRLFTFRVVNKKRCIRCGRASRNKKVAGVGVDETSLRRAFILMQPKTPENNVELSSPISLVSEIKNTLKRIIGDEKEDCQLCDLHDGVQSVGLVTGKLPNALLLGVMRGASFTNQVVLDEPKWLVLDKLIESNFNTNGDMDLRRTNLSTTLPAIAYHAARKAADEGLAIPRKANYKLVAVVRQWNGISGVEISNVDGGVTRIAEGKIRDGIQRRPNKTELQCSRLLVYERVGAENIDDEEDEEDNAIDYVNSNVNRVRTTRTPQTGIVRGRGKRRMAAGRNLEVTQPTKEVSQETADRLQAELAELEKVAMSSEEEDTQVEKKTVDKKTTAKKKPARKSPTKKKPAKKQPPKK